MAWPPRPGELLPRAEEAFGVRHKLMTYSLVKNHHSGGAKAKGFERILGITSETVEHLESEILRGILVRPSRKALPAQGSLSEHLLDLPSFIETS
jgi:hypothetical protein